MLQELRMSEMRYRAVLEVLDGAPAVTVARRFGVSRQTVHAWLRRYAQEGVVLNLEEPVVASASLSAEVEARVLVFGSPASTIGTRYRNPRHTDRPHADSPSGAPRHGADAPAA